MLKLVWAGAISVSVAIGVCSADELKPPLEPSSDISPDPVPGAGCPLSKPAQVVKAKLVVRNSPRNDVGPYSVKLPGYATDKIEDSYRPFLIRAKPGDTLRIDLVNQLDDPDSDNIVNLHTHGLIVAPRPYFPCNSLGDYIFDSVGPDFQQGGQTSEISDRHSRNDQGPRGGRSDQRTGSRQAAVPQRPLLVSFACPWLGEEPCVRRADGRAGHRSKG